MKDVYERCLWKMNDIDGLRMMPSLGDQSNSSDSILRGEKIKWPKVYHTG